MSVNVAMAIIQRPPFHLLPDGIRLPSFHWALRAKPQWLPRKILGKLRMMK